MAIMTPARWHESGSSQREADSFPKSPLEVNTVSRYLSFIAACDIDKGRMDAKALYPFDRPVESAGSENGFKKVKHVISRTTLTKRGVGLHFAFACSLAFATRQSILIMTNFTASGSG